MSLAVQILAALDTLAREERERAELGARLTYHEVERLRLALEQLTRDAIHTCGEQAQRRLAETMLGLGFRGPAVHLEPPSVGVEAGTLAVGVAGTAIMAEVQVDPDEIVLLPREATPSTASAASPRSAPVGSEEPPDYTLKDLKALFKMLLSMFESGEFLRFLQFSSDTAGILPLIPTGVAAPIQVFSQAVTALAQHALIDPRFFERLVAERPRREPEIRKMQARLLRA